MAVANESETRVKSDQVDRSGQRVRRMFGSIAGRYDLLNHLLSLNIDKSWRRRVVRDAPPVDGLPVLDCCTGTADLALAYDRATGGKTQVVGTDFCRPMLEIGVDKAAKQAGGRILLVEADTQQLPLPSDTFGVVTVAFGLRNIADTRAGLDEMIRVAAPGGRVVVLEFSKPRGRLLGGLYLSFFKHVLPRVGQAISPNDDDAYRYLPQSVMQFPEGKALLDLMAERGLTDLTMRPLTGSIATLYIGAKPRGGLDRGRNG